MKTYILKLKTTSTTNYNLYDGTTLVSDSDLATLFGSAGNAYFTFDFNESTPTNTTSLTILNSEDTAVMTNTGLEGIAEDRNFKGVWADSAIAFTSFTLLKGVAMDEAQLTTLVGMAKNAGIKTLTTADYNYPTTGTKTAWSADLADPGVYKVDEGITPFVIRSNANEGNIQNVAGGTIIVSGGTGAYRGLIVQTGTNIPFLTYRGNFYQILGYNSVQNNLTTSIPGYVLDALQGRLLNLKIGDLSTLTTTVKTSTVAAINELDSELDDVKSLSGNSAPTTATTGEIGQLYIDTSTGDIYYLESIDDTTDPDTYNWTKLAAGNVVQTTGSSTTDIMSQSAITNALATKADNTAFTGTDGSAAGAIGLVPAPATTDAGKFLKADGTWENAGPILEITDTDPGAGTTTAANTITFVYI